MIDGAVISKIWPLSMPFVILRSRYREIELVLVTLQEDGFTGRGECYPDIRHSESAATEIAKIKNILDQQSADQSLDKLVREMKGGAAKNALDCALVDLIAKQQGRRVWDIFSLEEPEAFPTLHTIPFGHPDTMASAAVSLNRRGCGQIRLEGGGDGDCQRIQAVRAAAPDAKLIIDANETWQAKDLKEYMKVMAGEGVALIEQPLPAKQDNAISAVEHLVPVCADESCLTVDDLPRVSKLYDFINIKLDKAGGLTAALELQDAAISREMGTMIGCMLVTSLAMAPVTLLANKAVFADLQGALFLKDDYDPALKVDGGLLYPPEAELWG